jgi:carboxyl-terminal processing protease
LELYLTDYGSETEQLQTKKDFTRIDKLPEGCLSFQEMRDLPHEQSWQIYQETLSENYAFSNRRSLNWAQLFEQYGDSLAASGDLFASMGQIATLCQDQHTKVIDSTGTSLQYRVTPSALNVQAAFEQQTEIENLGAFFDHFFKTSYKNISDSLLHGQSSKVANDNIEWGRVTPEIGYINIYSFAGFLNRDFTRGQQIDSLNKLMLMIVGELKDTKAIIVDVSFNFGGYDAAALTIASYFAQASTLAFTSEVYTSGSFYREDSVYVHPASATYNKPVYLLTTDISRSAAEGFAMMMKALPNVTHVGTPTLGTLSGMLGKSISYFYTTYSNQRLVTPAGDYFEVTGVIPEVAIEVFPANNALQGHRVTVDSIVSLINARIP